MSLYVEGTIFVFDNLNIISNHSKNLLIYYFFGTIHRKYLDIRKKLGDRYSFTERFVKLLLNHAFNLVDIDYNCINLYQS